MAGRAVAVVRALSGRRASGFDDSETANRKPVASLLCWSAAVARHAIAKGDGEKWWYVRNLDNGATSFDDIFCVRWDNRFHDIQGFFLTSWSCLGVVPRGEEPGHLAACALLQPRYARSSCAGSTRCALLAPEGHELRDE